MCENAEDAVNPIWGVLVHGNKTRGRVVVVNTVVYWQKWLWICMGQESHLCESLLLLGY